MWAEYEAYKNHFLQKQLNHLTPGCINENISKEIKKRQIRRGICDALHAPKIECKSARYFEDRAQLAYGFWALPKLMKEMSSDNAETQFRAINTLSEYLVNPLHAQRAITQFQIVRRCQNIFLRIRMKYQISKYRDADRLLTLFYFIAKHMNGAYEISHKNRLMDQFYIIIHGREEHMFKTSRILGLLTEQIEVTHFLINTYKVFNKLVDIWSRDICVQYYPEELWLHLQHILTMSPTEAVERGFFEILFTRIKGRLFQYHRYDLKCFALLLRCEEGQTRFQAVDGVKEMYEILTNSNRKLDTYENVVLTLMNGTFAKTILWRCREFTDLPKIITQFAMDSKQYNMQLLCLQLLRQLGVMPCIKRYIKENCLVSLKEIVCLTEVNRKEHTQIIYWLQREIYHTSDLRMEPIIPRYPE